MTNQFYRISDVCNRLGVGRTKVFELIKAGDLVKAKVGRCTCVTSESLKAFMTSAIVGETGNVR